MARGAEKRAARGLLAALLAVGHILAIAELGIFIQCLHGFHGLPGTSIMPC